MTSNLNESKNTNPFFLMFLVFIVLFCIDEKAVFGNQTNVVRDIVITGNQSFSQKQILSLMLTEVGKQYDADTLKKDTEKIAQFYKNSDITFARVKNIPKKFNDGVYISIEIDEGTIGKISLYGNSKTKDNIILRELLFEAGDIYTEPDRIESERILRQKSYIGAAKIEPKWDEASKRVAIDVTITEFFTLTGALDPGINNQSHYLLAELREPNLLGSGQGGEVRYERISEVDEKPRGFITMKYRIPRLVNSHWNFDGEYIQKREGDSWSVVFERPQYTLKSRWSAGFSISEQINHVRWFENGMKTDTFEQVIHRSSVGIQRYYGSRERQNYVGLWTNSQRTEYEPIESITVSAAAPINRDITRIGVMVGRKNVAYHQTRFIRSMGGDEDFFSGSQYSVSFGYASPLYGADRSESYVGLLYNTGWVYRNHVFGSTLMAYATSFTNQIEDSLFQARSSWYFRDVFNTGDIYRVDEGFRKDGLFDFQQTFVVQFKSDMQFGLSGESQVILGAYNGLRGYGLRQFSGEKMMLLSLESRTLCGGAFFENINNGLTKIATFFMKPFIRNRTVDLGLVLSGTVFADFGYIWENWNSFDIKHVKRSVGFGIRGSFAQISGAGIFRFELAYPLDPPFTPSIQPQLFYGIERAF